MPENRRYYQVYSKHHPFKRCFYIKKTKHGYLVRPEGQQETVNVREGDIYFLEKLYRCELCGELTLSTHLTAGTCPSCFLHVLDSMVMPVQVEYLRRNGASLQQAKFVALERRERALRKVPYYQFRNIPPFPATSSNGRCN